VRHSTYSIAGRNGFRARPTKGHRTKRHLYALGRCGPRPLNIAISDSKRRPATIGLVIDRSGSMSPKRTDVISAALHFVLSTNPQDEVFVASFNDNVMRPVFDDDRDFTSDYPDVRQTLLDTRIVGRTARYDALVVALRHLKWQPFEGGSRSISDGGDNASRSTLEEVVRLANESSATLYTIGFYDAGQR
jgi:hypothetical protein